MSPPPSPDVVNCKLKLLILECVYSVLCVCGGLMFVKCAILCCWCVKSALGKLFQVARTPLPPPICTGCLCTLSLKTLEVSVVGLSQGLKHFKAAACYPEASRPPLGTTSPHMKASPVASLLHTPHCSLSAPHTSPPLHCP